MARLVARSFLSHHPNARFVVAVVDRPIETRMLTDEAFEVLPLLEVDFGDEGFEYMATTYDVTEFATSVKPFLLRQLVKTADCVLYLDPDIFFYAPLDPLIDATMREGWSITPHALAPMARDETGPTEHTIMAVGVYNLGYIGVTKPASAFLDWWAERLRRDALNDPSNQMFTDQRWIDLAVPIFSPHIERSPAYNVAYWNVDQRNLWRNGDTYMVGDEPLRFLHFSGYDPKEPWWLSKHQPDRPRTLLSEHPILQELCDAYGAAMKAARKGEEPVPPYGWAEAFPGLPLTAATRRMFHRELVRADREETPKPPSPFLPDGAKRFDEWIRGVPEGSPRRLPRYLDVVYDERHDLQHAFPEVGIGVVDNFLQWVTDSGGAECASIALLGRPDAPPPAPPYAAADGGTRNIDGIDLIGCLNAELDMGEAARLLRTALTTVEVPVNTVATRRTTSRQNHLFETTGPATHSTLIMAVPADQIGPVRHQFGNAFLTGRYIIGQWFWEVEAFPVEQHFAFSLVDEVWVATNHVRAALLAASPQMRVELMPLPLIAPRVAPGLTRLDFGLDDQFMFLYSFDLLSVIERKNPFGAIEAFCRAFPTEGTANLVLKTINGRHRLRDLERLRWACSARDDIVLIDEHFDVDKSGALMAACDCYVSLHRAAGLGLTMAEAMSLGKPVIATGYSGNLDFMTDQTAHLIPWKPIELGRGHAPYPASATWADPDLDAAATAMRRVFDDPHQAVQMGERARADLATRFSPLATGERMKNRLEEIWSSFNV
jgi:glycosyltransferase involved in cell wall biosynthesis